MKLVLFLLYFHVPELRGKQCLSMLFHIMDVNPSVLNVESFQIVSCHSIYRINSAAACVMLCYVNCYISVTLMVVSVA
ncbi:hypothetical protein PVAP13_2NG401400 [Panicum virgatum]|uniref:Secreted protein n=1 Tax=Panicum virgatum TaxID=38727 RepID=A0A8T0VQR4_PANVG|nr:hypothetical protein PVAP13_2NG401400 [Panicum virgatum]